MSLHVFDENSPLLPVTRQKIDKLRETLKHEKLTPWFWFNSRGVKITRHDGGTIDISGCVYSQSQALVFFSLIEPFLKDAIVQFLDETLETCRVRGLTPKEPYIQETAMLLDGHLIGPIYRYIAEIDQCIRGKGDPKSVGRRDVTDEINAMVKFLDNCKDEMIQGIKAIDITDINQDHKGNENKPLIIQIEHRPVINIENKSIQTQMQQSQADHKKKWGWRWAWIIITGIFVVAGGFYTFIQIWESTTVQKWISEWQTQKQVDNQPVSGQIPVKNSSDPNQKNP